MRPSGMVCRHSAGAGEPQAGAAGHGRPPAATAVEER